MNAKTQSHKKSRVARFWALAAVIILLGCGLLGTFGLLYIMNVRGSPESQTAAIHARDPSFNLENTTPQVDSQALEATQEALLVGYGWIDHSANIVRIPIEQAMEQLAQNSPEQTPTVQP